MKKTLLLVTVVLALTGFAFAAAPATAVDPVAPCAATMPPRCDVVSVSCTMSVPPECRTG